MTEEEPLDMPSVPIPAEIVGDTDTIGRRLVWVERDLIIDALVIADRARAGGEVDERWTRDVVCHGDTRDVLAAEQRRRHVATALAHTDEPDLYAWTGRLVRGGRR